jgi:Fuc2NAc and GlcNAc transferase
MAMIESTVCVITGVGVVSVLATGAMRAYALRKNMLDIPNSRSSHAAPVPRGGGVAMVSAFFLGTLALTCLGIMDAAFSRALAGSSAWVALVGFLDDHKSLPTSVRFFVQLASATLLVALLGGVPAANLANWGLHGTLVGAAIAVLVVVWSTNLFNFMDGIDGIAASEAIFVAASAGFLNWYARGSFELTAVMICIASATSGFLVWNWPPAKIFMGDVGSGFLGFTLAALGLAASRQGTLPLEVLGILGGVFFVDATITLLRRLFRGERVSQAHRTHAYQHLARRFGSHQAVTLGLWTVNAFWLFPWAWYAVRRPSLVGVAFFAALVPIAILLALAGSGKAEENGTHASSGAGRD